MYRRIALMQRPPAPARTRLYDSMLKGHFAHYRQMAFVSGPRQVGKTTTCRLESTDYLNWDNDDDRRLILLGPAAVTGRVELQKLRAITPIVVFDELHKDKKWKAFLKGFFDVYGQHIHVIVTGSSRLDLYRRGSDSLMGRYFLYRMHPFSVAETIRTGLPKDLIQPPAAPTEVEWQALWEHGGFPEPFLKRDVRFTRRWRSLRNDQLTHEDMRDLAQIESLSLLDTLTQILAERSGQQLVYSNLANEVGISLDTAKRWIDLLARLHFGFLIRPWFKNVTKALRKEPKWFLRDWSGIEDPGQRAETFMACHLLKAIEGWTDLGFGTFELRYLRDKLKREVDFLVVRDRKPWFLVEVKTKDTKLSETLHHFQRETGAAHAFQAVADLSYVPADCFTRNDPTVVPMRTLLSQLL
jgi:predicted AAA+ superfamily ATPase